MNELKIAGLKEDFIKCQVTINKFHLKLDK